MEADPLCSIVDRNNLDCSDFIKFLTQNKLPEQKIIYQDEHILEHRGMSDETAF